MSNPLHFGMPTLIELADLDAQVAACRELGLDFIELNLDCPQYLPERIVPEYLRQVTAQTGIGFSAHLPENFDFASFHASVREGYLQCCRQVIDWASDAGITLLNLHLHSGAYFTLPAHKVWLYEQFQGEYRDNLFASFSTMCQLARKRNIMLCIENGGHFQLPHVANALHELLELGEGSLRLTWDVGHDAAAGFTDRPFLLAHRDSLAHMHLHDARGMRNHLPLGDGDAPIDEMASLAETLELSVVLETKTLEGLQQSVRWLQEHLLWQRCK